MVCRLSQFRVIIAIGSSGVGQPIVRNPAQRRVQLIEAGGDHDLVHPGPLIRGAGSFGECAATFSGQPNTHGSGYM
jgi:hypothetical protein